jgi:hypothetical protein
MLQDVSDTSFVLQAIQKAIIFRGIQIGSVAQYGFSFP